MRFWLCLVFLSMLGCASQEQIITPTPSSAQYPSKRVAKSPLVNSSQQALHRTNQVYPITINLPSKQGYQPYNDYLRPLLANLSEESIYQLKNSLHLRQQYRFIQQVHSTDKHKTVFSLKQPLSANWGYVTTSIGRKGVANAFLVESEQWGRRYALVIKQMKICLVSQAGAAPGWKAGKWRFSKQPGHFECTGSSLRSVFQPGSGFPGLLGPYYSEQDTILVFKQPRELKQLVRALKRQFPQLAIPVIPSRTAT